jgi:hypothetical protein
MRISFLSLASLLFFYTVSEAQDFCKYGPSTSPYKYPRINLRGSPEVRRQQFAQTQLEGLERLENDQVLERLKYEGKLVVIPESEWLRVDPRLHPKFRYLRPWAVQFVDNLAAKFFADFQQPLQINSAARTVQRQLELIKAKNLNASPVTGDMASVHPYGSTFDLRILGLTDEQLTTVRIDLQWYKSAGYISVAEEFGQRVFHIMVFRSYGDISSQKTEIADSAPH